jgi:hypothetical protein
MPERSALYKLVERILGADDFAWGLLTLLDDPLCDHFSLSQREEIINESIRCGDCEAARLLEKYPGEGPEDIAQEIGVPIHTADFKTSEKSKIIYFGQYVKGIIFIPEDTIREIERQYETGGLSELLGAIDPRSVMIAHEMFHCWEERNNRIETSTMKVRVRMLKFFHQNVTPLCASEIAAFAFARKLSGSTVHPRILELIGVYGVRPDLSQNMGKQLAELMAR